MKKIALNFPSKEMMAEFLIACKIRGGDVEISETTVIGSFDEECIQVALNQYQANIPQAPDFITT